MLSSISASMPELLGGYLASYAAANAGLDALAQAMRMSGHPWSALAYSVWGETGMGAEAGIVDAMARLGLRGLDSASAARAALRLAGSDQAFALVVDRAALRPGIGVSALPDPKSDLPAFVRAVIARVVTVDPEAVTRDATFTDLDIDSIGAVEMAVMLQEAGFYGIPDSVIFEVRTVGQLEDLLRDRLAAPGSAAPAPAMRETEAAPVMARPAVSEVGRVAHGFAMQSCLDPAISPFSYLRLTLPRPIDPTRLGTALKRIVSQHSALHRRFVWRGGTLVAEHAEMCQPAIFLYDVANDRALSRLDDSLATTPFVIGVAPLWRVAIITDGGMCHLAIAAHHAILDGWSLHRILEKTWRLYETPRSALPPEPDVPAIDRKDPELVAAYAVEIAEPWPTLPGLTGNVLSGPRAAVHRRLTEQDSRRVREAATSRGETYFMHVAASVARGIASWAGLDALVLQVAIARRGGEIHPDVIGSFSDTVPVRLGAHAGIADMRDAWDKAAKAGFPGLFDLHDLLGSAPDGGPKVASPFSLSVADFRTELRDGPIFSDIVARTATHATRLGFTVWRSGSGIGIALNYPPSWIAQAAAEALTDVVLEEILGSSDFAHFTDAILAQCARVPERIAIRHAGDSVSYGELEQVSARVAAGLDARGIGAGDIVGILAEPGIRATAAILGIARSGAAWLPLGQSQGLVRVKAMIEDAEPTLVINVGTKLDGLESMPLEKVMIDAPAPVVRHEPQDLAYVVFTSGSQGRPKGVPIRKESVSHYLHWSVGMMELTEADRLLQTAPLIFDASIRQLFAPLMVGAAMHPANQEDLSDPVALWCRMCGEQISVLNTSPMMATRIANAALGCGPPADGLRLVTIGGEALPESLVRKWFSIGGENLRIVNLYGPSETTINATWHEVARGDDPVPIGRPLPGYEGFVLDDTGKEVPEGELCIGGIGRFDGYLGNADVRFSRAPDGSTVYRTGDRVTRRPDGELIYLGRHDDQVQIQGVRIELAEVETALTACKAVDLALVRAVGEAPDRFLQAWVQTAREQWDETEVRRELLRRLPAVMIPRQICRCDRLPVTPSGKLDRRADLPVAPADGHLRGGPPRTSAEIKVAECWTRALGCGEIGIEDDFFALRGDSLSAISVSIELGADGAASLYANSRLRDYAAALEEILPTAAETAPSGPTRPTLLPAQIGFLRIGQNDPGSAVWSSVIALPGDIDEALLGEAWALLHERHPMLRAAFPGRRITYLDARPPANSTAAEAWPPALDPESGWLARARCVRGRDGASLEFIAHHLIGDAWSIAVMVRDFEALYDRLRAGEAPDLAPSEVLPEDIACRLAAQTVREEDTAYWRERMSAPYAAPFDDAPVGDIIRTHRMVPEAGARQVVGAVYAALRKSTGQADQIIAVARSGRDLPLPGIADVVAPLATALPVRINAGPNQDPVLAAAEAMQGALAHALNPSQILQAARLTRIPEIPVFVSDLRFPAKRSAAPARFEFDPSRTAFQLPTGTGMLVTVSRAAKGLRIAFTTRSGVFDAQAFEAFADMTVAALSARHSRSVALITYLPTRARLRSLLGMDPATLLGTEPRWLGEARTSSGTCRVLLLPKFADELDVGIDELARAVSLARSAGAQYVGLAGLLPSLTDYGHALASRLAPQDAAALTTGHAATAVAMAGTVLSALEQVKARWRDASVALVGVGSIGRATLGLLCEQNGTPAAISLCDGFSSTCDRTIRRFAFCPLPAAGRDFAHAVGAL